MRHRDKSRVGEEPMIGSMGVRQRVALLGFPNAGKTTLYNALTGARRAVGNWCGVSVDVEARPLRGGGNIDVLDYPGIYTFPDDAGCHEENTGGEEAVCIAHLRSQPPALLLLVMSAAELERQLPLARRLLLKTGIPGIAVLTKTDLLRRAGGLVNTDALTSALGIPVVSVTGGNHREAETLCRMVRDALTRPRDNAKTAVAPVRHRHSNLYRQEPYRSDGISRIDRFLLRRATGIPLMLIGMTVALIVCFGRPGAFLSDFVCKHIFTSFATVCGKWAEMCGISTFLTAFLTEGIIGGITGVLSLVPPLMLLFLLMSMAEESGVMARAGALFHPFLRLLGQNGGAVLSLLLGYGCTVSSVMASRTRRTAGERRALLFSLPFISCSARTVTCAYLSGILFPTHRVVALAGLLMLGTVTAVISLFCLRMTAFRGKPSFYAVELPPLQIPRVGVAFRSAAARCGTFIARAGTVVFLASAVLWLASHCTAKLTYAENSANSVLAAIGQLLTPLFVPLMFADWRCVAALLAGLSAKEAVCGSFAILFTAGAAPVPMGISAIGFACFFTLYTPCVAALSALRRELPRRYFAVALIYGLSAAYLITFAVVTLARVLI